LVLHIIIIMSPRLGGGSLADVGCCGGVGV